MNPVNDYLGPLMQRAFAPLVERSFLAFAYGGPGACAHAWGAVEGARPGWGRQGA